jgi:putative ABC transport system ATP-binding protein
VIRLEDLWRTYEMGEQELHALKGIDEEISDGEYVAIMGPSGSGKSTLLNVLGCLDTPSSGRYCLAGEDVAGLSEVALAEVRLRRIGFIFQSFHLVPRLTALQNVELPMLFAGVAPAERRARAEVSLDAVGLAERVGHKPNELSGGQKQRVAIARSTVMDPGLLLADEPTGNLDSRSGGQVLDLLAALKAEGRTLLVVTHDPAVARRADRVLVLRDGEIVKRVAGDEVTDRGTLFDEVGVGADVGSAG